MGLNADVRAAMASALSTALGDVAHVSPYMRSNPLVPGVQVAYLEEVEYDVAMQRGGDAWTWVVQVFAGITTDESAQETVDAFLDPAGAYSVKAALELDTTLGGIVDDLRVRSSDGYTVYTVGGIDVLGAIIRVDVLSGV